MNAPGNLESGGTKRFQAKRDAILAAAADAMRSHATPRTSTRAKSSTANAGPR